MEVKQFNKLLANPVLLDETTVEGLKTLTEEYPYFQAAWMLYLKNLKQIKSPEFEAILKQVAVRVSDRKKLFNFLNTNFHKKQAKVKLEGEALSSYKLKGDAENNSGDSLIDKFLSASPGGLRAGTEEDKKLSSANLKELVEKSTEESDEIITETLAVLYFQQKNYNKAAAAYAKLSLKYPEKSVYFATRIEEIEKLKNI
jgi:hypothetical protein